MPNNKTVAAAQWLFIGVSLLFTLFLYGAIPFVGLPTLSHAVQTSAFATSFADQSIFSVYANHFGQPLPAAKSFGLAGAWVQSLFLRMGASPADAYSLMNAFWLSIAFIFTIRLGQHLGAKLPLATLAAATWMSMPIGWGHTGFSMLSLGIALMPFYFYFPIKLYTSERLSRPQAVKLAAAYMSAFLISVFMDGYTFVMLVVGSSLLFGTFFLFTKDSRRLLLQFGAPLHAASIAVSYLLYRLYIGGTYTGNYSAFYALTGTNVCEMLIPPQNTFWLVDRLGVNSGGEYSISTSVFCLPLLILLGVVILINPKRRKLNGFFLVTALASFYLSLGPAMKIPYAPTAEGAAQFQGMPTCSKPSTVQLVKTGSEHIYKNIPGFNSMRVTFRWMALTIFMLWLPIAASLNQNQNKNLILVLGMLATIAINLPPPSKWWHHSLKYREMFLQLDREIAAPLGQSIEKNEMVAFLPWGNDVVAPYLAARGDFKTYNIAGDKNVLRVKPLWPNTFAKMGHLLNDTLSPTGAENVVALLREGGATTVVFIHLSNLWDRSLMPCDTLGRRDPTLARQPRGVGLICPRQWLAKEQPVIERLKEIPDLSVVQGPYFTLVRLKENKQTNQSPP